MGRRRDLALTMGTFGGVYRWRYCPRAFLEFLKASACGGFEDKGRFKDYVHGIFRSI